MFFSFAVRNLRRHWIRSALSIIGIVIGVIAIASLGIMGSSLSVLVGGMVSDVSDTVLVTPHLAASSGDPFDPRNTLAARISERDLGLIEKAAGQHRVIPMILASDRLQLRDAGGYVTMYALPAEDIPFLLQEEAGIYPQARSSGVMVGALLADELDLHPGAASTSAAKASGSWGSRRSGGWASTSTPTMPSSSRKTGIRSGAGNRTTAGSS
jgi:ABC-type transport system, involved in lipoprotein release, permease component